MMSHDIDTGDTCQWTYEFSGYVHRLHAMVMDSADVRAAARTDKIMKT